jgi:hypothetical protein
VEAVHSMIQGQYLALKMRASEKWLKLAGDPSTESNHRESEPPTDTDHRYHQKRENDHLQTVRQHGKACAANTHQDLPDKVVINSQLLDMQRLQGVS